MLHSCYVDKSVNILTWNIAVFKRRLGHRFESTTNYVTFVFSEVNMTILISHNCKIMTQRIIRSKDSTINQEGFRVFEQNHTWHHRMDVWSRLGSEVIVFHCVKRDFDRWVALHSQLSSPEPCTVNEGFTLDDPPRRLDALHGAVF